MRNLIIISISLLALGSIAYLISLEKKRTGPFPAPPVRIGIITDIHKCSAENVNSFNEQYLRNFVRDADSSSTDFNIDLGDMTSRRVASCEETAEQDLSYVVNITHKTSAPFYHVLGDHDISGPESLESWKNITGTKETFYSFDVKDVHVVILDNITGDGTIHPKCSEDELCSKYEKLKGDPEYEKKYLERKKVIDNSRDKKIRNRGSLSERQLDWLEKDLKKTRKNKIVMFSELPIYLYTRGDGKLFDIQNRNRLEKILFDSGKPVVSISGDAHTWYEHRERNVSYFGIDSFTHSLGNWAVLEWGENGFELVKMNSGSKNSENEKRASSYD